MIFEFDPDKSAANREKHGIDFIEAQQLWAVSAVEVEADFPGETRHLRIAAVDGRLWVAVFTIRSGCTRIISVRRARPKEKEAYDHQIRDR